MNYETYGRTSYFLVEEGKEREFLEYIRELDCGECSPRVVVDEAHRTLAEDGEVCDPAGFAILDCGDLQRYDDDLDDSEDAFCEIATRFLRPGCAMFLSVVWREGHRACGGYARCAVKDWQGDVVMSGDGTRSWVARTMDGLAEKGYRLTLPEE